MGAKVDPTNSAYETLIDCGNSCNYPTKSANPLKFNVR